ISLPRRPCAEEGARRGPLLPAAALLRQGAPGALLRGGRRERPLGGGGADPVDLPRPLALGAALRRREGARDRGAARADRALRAGRESGGGVLPARARVCAPRAVAARCR